MEESTYHQMSEQHIRLQDQARNQAHPPQLTHQSPTHGDHNPWAAEARLEAHLQQGLVAVQDLERQRLKLLQDLVESPPL
jgi:hypothetical protein